MNSVDRAFYCNRDLGRFLEMGASQNLLFEHAQPDRLP